MTVAHPNVGSAGPVSMASSTLVPVVQGSVLREVTLIHSVNHDLLYFNLGHTKIFVCFTWFVIFKIGRSDFFGY